MEIEYFHAIYDLSDKYRKGFVKVYKEAFGGPPYYEVYQDREVIDKVWNLHLQDGKVILAKDGEKIVGFVCALPLLKSPLEIQLFLREKQKEGKFPVNFEDCWYISELGVLLSYRRKGIGTLLVGECLGYIRKKGAHFYVMRTAALNSNSLMLFKKIGALQIPGAQDVSNSEQVKIYGSQSLARIYLYGSCAEALERISQKYQKKTSPR